MDIQKAVNGFEEALKWNPQTDEFKWLHRALPHAVRIIPGDFGVHAGLSAARNRRLCEFIRSCGEGRVNGEWWRLSKAQEWITDLNEEEESEEPALAYLGAYFATILKGGKVLPDPWEQAKVDLAAYLKGPKAHAKRAKAALEKKRIPNLDTPTLQFVLENLSKAREGAPPVQGRAYVL